MQTANGEPYTLTMTVNEVSLNFHASDLRGKPIQDLSSNKLQVSDNGRLQERILSLQLYQNLPIRAGFLFDRSESMAEELDRNASIANLYASLLLRRGQDRAFVAGFDTHVKITRDWTDDPKAISSGIDSLRETQKIDDLGAGTAIFDSLYLVCRDRWNAGHDIVSGNFILLFTDGIDNASHARIDDVIDICQRTRTAIYIFTNQWNTRGSSQGSKTLHELATKSGGRLFLNPDDNQVAKDVQMIDEDRRNQYQLIYRPSDLKPDGSFHRIRIHSSKRGTTILVRSGYYAPGRP